MASMQSLFAELRLRGVDEGIINKLEVQIKAKKMFKSGQALIETADRDRDPARRFTGAIKPALEVGGLLFGGAAGSALGPAGTAGGGALGFGLGRQLGRRLDESLGLAQRPQNLRESLTQGAKDVQTGALTELGARFIPRGVAGVRSVGRGLADVGQAVTGRAASGFRRLANEPTSLFARNIKTAGAELGAAEAKLGIPQIRTGQDVLKNLTVDEIVGTQSAAASKAVKPIIKKLQAGSELSADELVKGIRALDDIIGKIPSTQGKVIRIKALVREELTKRLSQIAPELAAARTQFARSSIGDQFRRVFPTTKSGDVSITRSVGLPFATQQSEIPGILGILPSPFVAGGLTSALGAGGKLLGPLENPAISRAVAGSISSLFNRTNQLGKSKNRLFQ